MVSTAAKLLFVCTMNQWRSPTAEKIYSDDARVNVRSRGTSRKAVQSLCGKDILWADMIMVMETKHRQQIRSRFPGKSKYSDIRVLEIPDEYRFMDPELIQLIHESVEPVLLELA